MALNPCRDCDTMVSETARHCPNCGCFIPQKGSAFVSFVQWSNIIAFRLPLIVAIWMFLLS